MSRRGRASCASGPRRAQKFAVGGLTAAALLDILKLNYALAVQVQPNDNRIRGAKVPVHPIRPKRVATAMRSPSRRLRLWHTFDLALRGGVREQRKAAGVLFPGSDQQK